MVGEKGVESILSSAGWAGLGGHRGLKERIWIPTGFIPDKVIGVIPLRKYFLDAKIFF